MTTRTKKPETIRQRNARFAKRMRKLEEKVNAVRDEANELYKDMEAAGIQDVWSGTVFCVKERMYSGGLGWHATEMDRYETSAEADIAARKEHWSEIYSKSDDGPDKDRATFELKALGIDPAKGGVPIPAWLLAKKAAGER